MTQTLLAHTLLTAALLHWIVLIVPGPNMLIVCSLAAQGERRSALCAAVGISLVAMAWASLAAFGLGSLLAVHAQARAAMQIAGGAYLVHIAARLWRAQAPRTAPRERYTAAQALRLGITTNMLNPKSTLFFASVFAAALPQSPSPALIAAVVGVVAVNALAWHIALALVFSGRAAQGFYAAKFALMGRVVAVVLGALGLKLIFSTLAEAIQSDL